MKSYVELSKTYQFKRLDKCLRFLRAYNDDVSSFYLAESYYERIKYSYRNKEFMDFEYSALRNELLKINDITIFRFKMTASYVEDLLK